MTIFLLVLQLHCTNFRHIRSKRQNIKGKKLEVVVTLENPEDSCKTTTTTTCSSDLFDIPTLPTPKKDEIICSEPGANGYPETSKDFFICHKKEDKDGLEKIELSCPDGMIFDRSINKCRRRGFEIKKWI